MASNALDLTNVANVQAWLSMQNPSAQELQAIQDCITAASAYWLWALGVGPQNGGDPTASPLNSILSNISEVYDGNCSARLFVRIRPIVSVASLSVNGVAIPASSGINTPGFVIDGSGKSIAIRAGFGAPATGRLTVGFSFLRNGCRGWTFGEGIQNVQVTYSAGFAPTVVTNELQTIPAGTGLVTVNLQPWFTDNGVKYFATGIPFAAVGSAPGPGQYYIQANGQYLFNSADIGSQVQISYTATGVPYDISMAVRQMVAVNYKRRQWIDQKMQAMAQGAGTVNFRDWEFPPEVRSVMEQYRRRAIA